MQKYKEWGICSVRMAIGSGRGSRALQIDFSGEFDVYDDVMIMMAG